MVERVVKVLPQEQETWTSWYFGWISAFTLCPFVMRPADVADLENARLSSNNHALAMFLLAAMSGLCCMAGLLSL
jgi:hypothetical protein